MKRKIKGLLTMLVIAAILFATLCASASAETATDGVAPDESGATDAESSAPAPTEEAEKTDTGIGDTADNTEKADTGVGDTADNTEKADTGVGDTAGTDNPNTEIGGENSENTATDVEGESKNPFESFYETVLSYSGEIFCLITLIVTLFLTNAYKRGLVPLLKGAVGAIGGAVGSIKEKAEEESEKIDRLSSGTEEKILLLEKGLARLTDTLQGIVLTLGQLEADKNGRERVSAVLASQTEMLYDLIMTSALPAYQKELIGEKMLKMKEKINEGSRTNGTGESD